MTFFLVVTQSARLYLQLLPALKTQESHPALLPQKLLGVEARTERILARRLLVEGTHSDTPEPEVMLV